MITHTRIPWRKQTILAGLGALLLLLLFAAPSRAQAPRRAPFRATHYDVEATLHPADQTLSARAKVDFVAEEASRTVVVELHQDLKVNAIIDAGGRKLAFDRNPDSPLQLSVTLVDAAAPGKQVTLTFEYAGPLSSEEDSPSRGVRLASVDQGSAYLLLPARWFPLTDYPSNRYTATFKIISPDTFAVVGTGASASPSVVQGGQVAYTFHNDRPEPSGSFVAGALQLSPVKAEGLQISVFAPAAAGKTPVDYGNTTATILNYFSSEFGPLPSPDLTVAQMPDGSLQGFSAPGLILISARQWSPKPNLRLVSQLAAGQWWGNEVLAASPSDVWLTDGLAQYSGGLYAEHIEGNAGLHRALEDFAIGTLMYEDAAPIAQAQRLAPYSDQYRSIVVDKGAMVFHMLRSALGDAPFESLLHDFAAKFTGKTARIEDFEKMAQTRIPAAKAGQPALNLTAFFSQWLNSTGVPEFKLEYTTYRIKKGFKIVGKVRQDLETFHLPIEVRVDTEGNPEIKTIEVVGTSSPFEIETFGRPKPGGIVVDPNNNLLKSSPHLRVRAAVARGESEAEVGKYYEAIQDYQQALDIQANNSLAHFRMGEAMFYQKNYQASANAFRSSLDGDLDPSYRWVEVWSHIYLGKIFDLTGQRERAVNEYSRATQLADDTGGAQAEAARYLNKPYAGDNAPQASAAKP
jgi:aminopeptidase N